MSLLFVNCDIAQENTQRELIKDFIIQIKNNKIDAKKIVDTYLQIKTDKENTLSLKDRKQGVVSIIEKMRTENREGNPLIPIYSIDSIKKYNIYPFKEFENLNKYKFSGIKKLRNNAFVLLNDKRDKILQYFLLNREHNKIVSFSLFVKTDLAWFFEY